MTRKSDAAELIHYKPHNGYFGDPIPFYWNGVYHIFYLRAPLEPKRQGADFTACEHLTSKDLLNWREEPTALWPEDGKPDERSCWTGSIIEKDGVFYFFYTGHNPDCKACPQSICLALSSDLTHWEKLESNPLFTPDDPALDIRHFRDPYVFWDAELGRYVMSLTTMDRHANRWTGGMIRMYESDDLMTWRNGQTIYYPGNHGFAECSDVFFLDGHWYMLVNIFDKACLRMGPSPRGPWRPLDEGGIDGIMNYAMKTICDGHRRYALGWVRTLFGNVDRGPWEWAGHMSFPRELHTDEAGNVFVRLPAAFDCIRGVELWKLTKGSAVPVGFGSWQWHSDVLTSNAEGLFASFQVPSPLSFNLDLEFKVESDGATAGVLINGGQEATAGYEVAVDLKHNTLMLREHTQRFGGMASQDIIIRAGEPVRMRVIRDATVLEVFVNDRYALSCRCYDAPEQPALGFFVENGEARLKAFSICELNAKAVSFKSCRATRQEAALLQLYPTS